MASVPMDPAVVAACRQFAADIADDVQHFIDRHTTVGVERTVARAYGVVGADAEGTPLVNVLCDKLHAAKALDRGVAYFLGRALLDGASNVQEAAEALAFGPPVDLSSGPSPAEAEGVLARDTADAIARIDKAAVDREAFKGRFPLAETPLKYVIVATGNIYDDAVQAKAARFA